MDRVKLNMNKSDRWFGVAFKATVVLYVLAIASQRIFRPDIYRVLSVLLEVLLALLLLYIGAKWALTKLGLVQYGSFRLTRSSLVKTAGTVAALILFSVFVEYVIHNLSLTQEATADLRRSQEGRNALGESIRVGWYIYGSQTPETANFSIPVKGSKASGKLEMRGIRHNGFWSIVSLYLVMDGNGAVVQISH